MLIPLFTIFGILCALNIVFIVWQLRQPEERSGAADSATHEEMVQIEEHLNRIESLLQENKELREKIVEEREKNDQSSLEILEINKEVARQAQENRELTSTIEENEKKRAERASLAEGMLPEDLKSENDELKERAEHLMKKLESMKDLNDQLVEKDQTMQYDVTRSRAQALGLEKICGDFKIKVEQMAKRLEEYEQEK